MRFSLPTYIVVDMPTDIGEYVRGLRLRFSPLLAPLPVEITLVGSSGVGVLASDTSPADAIAVIERIAGATAPLQLAFGKMTTFPSSGVYYYPPVNPLPWEELHRIFATSGLRFAPTPFLFTPHLTAVKFDVPEPPEEAAAALALAPPPPGEAVALSLYTLDGYGCTLLHRTHLSGPA